MTGSIARKQILNVACASILWLTLGFTRAPFARWAVGQIMEIIPREKLLVIRTDGSARTLSCHWNEETRFWIEPVQLSDRGSLVDTKALKIGARVRIMFKKYSDHYIVTKVIRRASPVNGS